MRPAVAAQRIAATARATAVAETLRRRARTVVGDAAATSTAASTTTTEKHVLQKDFVQVVGSATSGYDEAEITIDADGKLRVYTPPSPAVTGDLYYREDFLTANIGGWTQSSASGGASYATPDPTVNNPGIMRVSGGGTSGGSSCAYPFGSCMRLVAGTTWEAVVAPRFDATTGTVLRLGISSLTTGTSEPANGVFFEYRKDTSANWRIRSGSSSTYTTTTSSTAVAFGSFLKFRITYDGTTLTFSVNGVSLGTITTNIPTAATMHPFFFATHATAAAFTLMDVDLVTVHQTGLSR